MKALFVVLLYIALGTSYVCSLNVNNYNHHKGHGNKGAAANNKVELHVQCWKTYLLVDKTHYCVDGGESFL